MKRGRKQKSGERYPGGKLKPQRSKGPLADYQLDQAREFIRKRVADPVWWKRAGWLNLNQRLSDDLTSAAFNFATLFGPLQFVAPTREKPNPKPREGWVHGRPTPSPEAYDDDKWTSREKGELVDRIKRELTPREMRAVRSYALAQEQPYNWDILERALTTVHYIIKGSAPVAKNTLMDSRRSEFVKDDVPVMLEVRGLKDHERFIIAYASANAVPLPAAALRGAKLGLERARQRYPDFDQYLPAITRLFDEGVIERTGNRDKDYAAAYKLAKYGTQTTRKKNTG